MKDVVRKEKRVEAEGRAASSHRQMTQLLDAGRERLAQAGALKNLYNELNLWRSARLKGAVSK